MLRSVTFWSCVKCLLQFFFFLTYRNRKNESSVCFHTVHKALSGSMVHTRQGGSISVFEARTFVVTQVRGVEGGTSRSNVDVFH